MSESKTSRRMSRQESDFPEPTGKISEWVSNPRPGHFLLRWVPLPPEARREVVRAPDGGLSERVRLDLGCPHCHEDITFAWEAQSMGGSVLRDMYQIVAEIRSYAFSLSTLALGGSPLVRRLLDVAERLHESLRRW